MTLTATRQIGISTPDGVKWQTMPVNLRPVLEAAKLVCDAATDEELKAARELLRKALKEHLPS